MGIKTRKIGLRVKITVFWVVIKVKIRGKKIIASNRGRLQPVADYKRKRVIVDS